MLTLVLGGAASGKSAVAEAIAADAGSDVLYVATGVATDPDMAARIEAHRRRRPSTWSTVESNDLVAALCDHPDRPVMIDSLGTWVAHAERFAVDLDGLVVALRGRRARTVIVSDEVGLGVHPETEIGRRFRDAMGRVNRHVADVAGEVLLVIAGRAIRVA